MNETVNAKDGLFEIGPNEWVVIRNNNVYFLIFKYGTDFGSNMYGEVCRGSGSDDLTLQTFYQEEITCKYALDNIHELDNIHDTYLLREHRRKNFLIQAQDFLDNVAGNK